MLTVCNEHKVWVGKYEVEYYAWFYMYNRGIYSELNCTRMDRN